MSATPEHVYRAAENAEVECSQQGCRRRDCNGVICRKSIDAALALAARDEGERNA